MYAEPARNPVRPLPAFPLYSRKSAFLVFQRPHLFPFCRFCGKIQVLAQNGQNRRRRNQTAGFRRVMGKQLQEVVMFPAEFLKKMYDLLGPDAYAAFLAAADRPRSVALRMNRLKSEMPPELPAFGLTPVPWARDGFYYAPEARPGLSPYHEAGLYYLQEASAMAPAELLDVQPGMRVLDLCAAPGGKSGQLASALQGRGLLVSNEINPRRAAVLGRNLERLGVANALVLCEHPQRLEERFAGFFDRILVDAPCSGEGMFRKEAAASADWSPEAVRMCARRQREILSSAAAMLRPGGRMVYSTCTFSPEENEGVIDGFLKTHSDFEVGLADAPWAAPGRPEWVEAPSPGLERTVRLWPHRVRGEGHFAAVLEKEGAPGGILPEPAAEPAVPAPPELEAFCRTAQTALPPGRLVTFGRRLWLAPAGTPALCGLRVLRPGLELGQVLKGRFEPAHAWALWLKSCASTADFPEGSREIAAYLAGDPIAGPQTGWTLLTVDGLSLGWVKGSGGVLKNHLPKGLRRMAK